MLQLNIYKLGIQANIHERASKQVINILENISS